MQARVVHGRLVEAREGGCERNVRRRKAVCVVGLENAVGWCWRVGKRRWWGGVGGRRVCALDRRSLPAQWGLLDTLV